MTQDKSSSGFTPEEREDFLVKVTAMRDEMRSWRLWLRQTLRSSILVGVLALGLWGAGLEPVTAARVVAGLWCAWTLTYATCTAIVLTGSIVAVTLLGGKR